MWGGELGGGVLIGECPGGDEGILWSVNMLTWSRVNMYASTWICTKVGEGRDDGNGRAKVDTLEI